jgi:hypothetical protein
MSKSPTNDSVQSKRDRVEVALASTELGLKVFEGIIVTATALGAHGPATDTQLETQKHEPPLRQREQMNELEEAYGTAAEQQARRIVEQAKRDMATEAAAQRNGVSGEPEKHLDTKAEASPSQSVEAHEYVEQTRRLAEVVRVMRADGHTAAEIERVEKELNGRCTHIDRWPEARIYRNRTGTIEERQQSLEAARKAKVETKVSVRF